MTQGRTAIFDPRAFLATAGKGRTVAEYRKHEIVFSQGDQADAVFYIQRGRVQLAVVSARGREVVVSKLRAGAFFGEGCLAVGNLRTATASALTACRIVRMDKAAMARGLANQPGFSAVFIAHLLAHGIRVEEDLVDHLFDSSEKRLARVLLLLANFGQDGQPESVIPKISQGTLAEMLGTTRSRVSFLMNKFRRLGFIHYGEGLVVRSSLLSVVLHD
jgi:CRP/FNR family transcriptional regulator, cyclic AMP receptor protein